MKKFLSVIMCLCVVFLAGCGEKSAESERLNIVVTVFPQYDFVRAVAGDKADITMLIKPGNEAHTYDPTPKEVALISGADLFIYVGSESEDWVSSVLESSGISPDRVMTLFSMVETLEKEQVEGMEHEHEDEDEHSLDEHVWTSPKNAAVITECIARKLMEIDPLNADVYSENAEKYIDEIDALDKGFQRIVNEGKRNTVIFADRFPARYFAEEYGIEYFAAFPGCSADAEPSASVIAFLSEKVKEEGIPYVFYIEFSNQKTADIICEMTGAEKLLFHSCHNVSKEDFDSGRTYVDIMRQNAENLEEALG